MPGLVAFRRRWSIGSDDLVVPGAVFFVLHLGWLVVLCALLSCRLLDPSVPCQWLLALYTAGLTLLLTACCLCEAVIIFIAMRGSILNTEARANIQYFIYARLALMSAELGWIITGSIWLHEFYSTCEARTMVKSIIGCISCQSTAIVCALITAWCTFDPAGRSWLKMRRYQKNQQQQQRRPLKRSSGQRNWRQRKVLRAYRNSWNSRCRLLFCCVDQDRNQSSFADIADLLSEFFRDLDVVPSDIVAGLILLRQTQKLRRREIINTSANDTYQFLSGARITPGTLFVGLNNSEELDHFKEIIYYMRYAMSIYGWPLFMMQHSAFGCCLLCPYLRWCRHLDSFYHQQTEVVEDNCCACNTAATRRGLPADNVRLIYVTYHVDVGETPFLLAVDNHKHTVVLCVRGTMSLKDVVTDLDCGSEPIPSMHAQGNWFGHKGMVQAAVYIRDKLASLQLLEQAFAVAAEQSSGQSRDLSQRQHSLVLVGHSLGAGTAAILALLMKDKYPDLHCFAYSPPGGLLSEAAAEYSKHFITSVVVGKDVVPRIGLHQMEQLRTDLLQVIKRSDRAKWRSIGASFVCCGNCNIGYECGDAAVGSADLERFNTNYISVHRHLSAHPCNQRIALTVHQPLFPPGRMMHVVRRHGATSKSEKKRRSEPIYQALWVENSSFDEVIVSPVMIQDHMPDKVLEALEKVLADREVFGSTTSCRVALPHCCSPAPPHESSPSADDNDNGSQSTWHLVWSGEAAPIASPDSLSQQSSQLPSVISSGTVHDDSVLCHSAAGV